MQPKRGYLLSPTPNATDAVVLALTGAPVPQGRAYLFDAPDAPEELQVEHAGRVLVMTRGGVLSDSPPLPTAFYLADRNSRPDQGPAAEPTDYARIERRDIAARKIQFSRAPAPKSVNCGRGAFAVACTDLLVRALHLPGA